ncbi:GNAT family N-acetyltransferase [Mycobacterium sp. 236(2023)]|uniref:GNAT family N-acetyltransferase n=1 Tax=Mycobacterium sp. 236(2023) TaxID=3038163 RepID=UPI002414D945|nr:GNAT family N-acetyltransferase [Mycobacterium sp. 236(2023)]MDG4668040.1 GNAT family N-acetyltransferase [Mycobacterium sp. 236(2023)]
MRQDLRLAARRVNDSAAHQGAYQSWKGHDELYCVTRRLKACSRQLAHQRVQNLKGEVVSMTNSEYAVSEGPVFRMAHPDTAESRRVLAEYADELAVAQGILLEQSAGGGVAEDPSPPDGAFLLADLAGVLDGPIACAGLRRLTAETGEIKRMYVAPAARGRGVARKLLARIEEEARVIGYRSVRLDTASGMVAAQGLYGAAGYRRIDDYNGNPHASFWMEKTL